MADAPLDLRCFCRRKPLLGVCGRDAKTGDPYVHVKSHRQDRIFVELVVTAGVVRIRCRDCLRWHSIAIRSARSGQADLVFREESLPEGVLVGAR